MDLEEEHDKAIGAQRNIVSADRPVFVNACPGAGKTRVLIERAQRLQSACAARQGVAILSFSNAAIEEIESRLAATFIAFPSFLGTFDSFMWRFLIAPFGAENPLVAARLYPDLAEIRFSPTLSAQGAKPMRLAKLGWFDRGTGAVRGNLTGEDSREVSGFDGLDRYEAHARACWRRLVESGGLDHDLARELALIRLNDRRFDPLITALGARFAEVIVDEAQDCNPQDIDVVLALRAKGVAVSVIADIDQAIYGFRHGGAPALRELVEQYPGAQRHALIHNFRSNERICELASLFREKRSPPVDVALEGVPQEEEGAYLIVYKPGRGNAVSNAIGTAYGALLDAAKIPHEKAPIIAHRENSARRAAGLQPIDGRSGSFVVKLASAIASYEAARAHWRTRADALARVTALTFGLRGLILEGETLHQCLNRRNETIGFHRGEILAFAEKLCLSDSETAEAWLARVKKVVATDYPDANHAKLRKPTGKSLRELEAALAGAGATRFPVSTVHCVKGQEFPSVCVVIPPRNIEDLFDRIESATYSEAERVLFVGLTRAERLCVLAIPARGEARITSLLAKASIKVEICRV